jgi:hypothetical protein
MRSGAIINKELALLQMLATMYINFPHLQYHLSKSSFCLHSLSLSPISLKFPDLLFHGLVWANPHQWIEMETKVK